MTANKKLFLSAVSSEFVSCRNLLADDLKRPNLDIAVQEDFVVTGRSTLEKVDDYIRHCDAVIHLLGKATGAVPEEPAVAALLAKYPDFGTLLPPLDAHLRKPQPGFITRTSSEFMITAKTLRVGGWSVCSMTLIGRFTPHLSSTL